ncbi:phospholipase A [Bermanella marisrubri]|uniref:Phospholipase A1 n=1 Tax=Bermanella marisrubri TaxID=207949 RepID=Q1N0Y7_9GAMM|nr:phospholipase A [Bermanella marisrubri]EAT11887.1 Outer membrane phospholipase A [Oceanobacter sp. RED65] [Bermanella marisrubri]QIZ83036.1 phospholipase A [Bermanella marisrubri]
MIKFKLSIATFIISFSLFAQGIENNKQDVMSNEEIKDIDIPQLKSQQQEQELSEEESAEALNQALERQQIIEKKAAKLPFLILPHRPNYFMPFAYMQKPRDTFYKEILGDEWPGFDNYEAIFQLSVKYQVGSLDEDDTHRIYLAYTGKSFWQVYNNRLSRPFRETNHEPELILQMQPDWGYINRFDIKFNHQSNGQVQGLSRSWNRIILGFYKANGDSIYGLEPWWRIPETGKADPADPEDNDNPNMYKYLGYANFIWFRKRGSHSLLFRAGNNLNIEDNKGWTELEWTFPVSKRVRGFIQWYEGYGHSLIEYDQYQRRIGLGFKISDYL